MGEIIEVSIVMWFVAVAAFAPLGYFIYLFMKDGGASFGKSDPADHSVESSKYYHVINSTMSKILGSSTAKPATSSRSVASAAPAVAVNTASSKPSPATATSAKKTTASKKSTTATGRKRASTTKKS